jgi:hypothetical protein
MRIASRHLSSWVHKVGTTTSPADGRVLAAVVQVGSGNSSELPRYTWEGLTLGRQP